MAAESVELLQGTLDLLVLKTLSWGSTHGYGIARWIQQVTGDVKVLNAKLDNGVIWRITELERRLNSVEQATKTP